MIGGAGERFSRDGEFLLEAQEVSANGSQYFFAVDPFHCTQNCSGSLRFVNTFLIIDKLYLAAFWHGQCAQ